MATTHPYFPTTLEIPNYTPPTHALPTLLALFGLIAGAIITLGITVTNYLNPQFPARRKVAAAWFLLSGLLHIHFEGYFIKHRYTLAARSDLFADLWKEYALSDSRYLVTDGFVVAIETLTVVSLCVCGRGF